MNFPSGVIYIWSGTNASIPTGWSRETTLDGKYPKGTANATDPNETGGAATHTHTSDAHVHAAGAHTHPVTFNAASANNNQATGAGTGVAIASHTHTGTSGALNSGGTLSSVAATYASFANDPPYHAVIFIKPSSPKFSFPQNAIYLYEGTDSKTGHYLCDGDNSTPNLVDKYLKGAGTGADAGTTGGTVTNTHELTHASTHTASSHTHANSTSGNDSAVAYAEATDNDMGAAQTHTISPAAATDTIEAAHPSVVCSETVEPAYTKLLTVQNQTVDGKRLGMIGMWLGTLASIPANYTLCNGTGTTDMRGKYLKSTATTGDIAGTGGANTHTHEDVHTHTSAGHVHTHSNVDHQASKTNNQGSGQTAIGNLSAHTVTVSSALATYADATTTAASSSNEPEYRTVAFIKLNSIVNSAASLFMSMMSLGQ